MHLNPNINPNPNPDPNPDPTPDPDPNATLTLTLTLTLALTLTLTLALIPTLPLSRSEEQVRETFHSLQGTVNVLGRTNREVPLMEYP